MAGMIGYRLPGTQRHRLGRLGTMWGAGAKCGHRFSTPFVSHGIPRVLLTPSHAVCLPLVTNLSPDTLACRLMSSPAAAGSRLVFFHGEWRI
jgi:hypothetical protein